MLISLSRHMIDEGKSMLSSTPSFEQPAPSIDGGRCDGAAYRRSGSALLSTTWFAYLPQVQCGDCSTHAAAAAEILFRLPSDGNCSARQASMSRTSTSMLHEQQDIVDSDNKARLIMHPWALAGDDAFAAGGLKPASPALAEPRSRRGMPARSSHESRSVGAQETIRPGIISAHYINDQ